MSGPDFSKHLFSYYHFDDECSECYGTMKAKTRLSLYLPQQNRLDPPLVQVHILFESIAPLQVSDAFYKIHFSRSL